MDYPRVVRLVMETPWAILPSMLETIVSIVSHRAQGGRLTPEEIQERLAGVDGKVEAARPPGPGYTMAGASAIIPVTGVLAQRMDMMTQVSGGTSTERLATQYQAAMDDPSVASIVLDVDSPGGSVFGIQELADVMYANRGRKPVVAAANSLMASAAYWLGSQADEISITPGGELGSIGVLTVHRDVSRAVESEGVKVSYVSAGKYKTEGNPYEPLGDEARQAIQARIDDYYAMFVRSVARGRKVAQHEVRDGFGQGRVVGAREAVRLGMADRIETLAETVARYQTPAAAGRKVARAEDDLELRRRRARLAASRIFRPLPAAIVPPPVRRAEEVPVETSPAEANLPIGWRRT